MSKKDKRTKSQKVAAIKRSILKFGDYDNTKRETLKKIAAGDAA